MVLKNVIKTYSKNENWVQALEEIGIEIKRVKL